MTIEAEREKEVKFSNVVADRCRSNFEQLLDQIDAERIAHNEYFKANENNLNRIRADNPYVERLYEFEQRIHELFGEADKIIRAAGRDTPAGKWLRDIAAERSKLRPQSQRRDPKVIREEARQWTEETRRKHKGWLNEGTAKERKEWARVVQHHQEQIDKQGGKCAECGEPLNIYDQGMGAPPNMICDICCHESFAYHGDPIL